jgi:predicted RND superfamily exporter protein
MAVLNKEDFMKQIKEFVGDKNDDVTLKFIEDANDTITSWNDDYKAKYETAVKEKEDLDKEWRNRYKSRFFDDTNINNNNNNNNNTGTDNNNPFDERTEEQKKAETITVNDLFTKVD